MRDKTKNTGITIVEDFFNKLVWNLDNKYFPNVSYYRDNKECTKVHYAVELFNNGMIQYDKLINDLSINCGDTKENIEIIVNKYIKSFGSYY